MRLTLDKAGRVVLPKPIRDELQLQPGDSLELESSNDGITLRPLRGGFPLRKKQGIWVYGSSQPLPADIVERTLKAVRRERDLANLAAAPKKHGKSGRSQ